LVEENGELDEPVHAHRRLYVDIGPEERATLRAQARRNGRTPEAEAAFLLAMFFLPSGTLGSAASPQEDQSLVRFGGLILDLPLRLLELLARMAAQEYRTVSGAAAVVLGAVLQNGQTGKRAPTKGAKRRGRPRKGK
jgi:hypothetical protein